MEGEAGLIWVALSALLLCTTVGIGIAYSRTKAVAASSDTERAAYEQVIEGSNDAVLVIDFVDGRILRANERAARMLGRSRDGMTGLTVFDLHAPEDLALSATRIADAWEKKGTVYDDIPFRSSDGEIIAVECSTTVTYHADRPAVVLFARDIRERLRLQGEVRMQQSLVREKSEEILASLRYASTIQSALMPTESDLRASFADAFVLFKPRDIVSGDFHWTARIGGTVIVAVADCTGHGVPGAFLSMIGNSLLRNVVLERGIVDPGAILDGLREGFAQVLRGSGERDLLRDGMDIALVAVDIEERTALFAGAMNPLLVLHTGETDPTITEYKADRLPIGFQDGFNRSFTTKKIQLKVGDRLYLFSDGFADQFGGTEGKRMKMSGLKQRLLETVSNDMVLQRAALERSFSEWCSDAEQVDDVLLLGFRV